MSRFDMPVLLSIVSGKRLVRVSQKYHLIEEDSATIPGAGATIDQTTPGKIVFYLYYFEEDLRVPTSIFFGQVIDAYKIHTCQLKPNSISKIICFVFLCHASLVIPMVDFFNPYFLYVVLVLGYICFHLGRSLIEVLPNQSKYGSMSLSGWMLHNLVIQTFFIILALLRTKGLTGPPILAKTYPKSL